MSASNTTPTTTTIIKPVKVHPQTLQRINKDQLLIEALRLHPEGLRFTPLCKAAKKLGYPNIDNHLCKRLKFLLDAGKICAVPEYVGRRRAARRPGCGTARRYYHPTHTPTNMQEAL